MLGRKSFNQDYFSLDCYQKACPLPRCCKLKQKAKRENIQMKQVIKTSTLLLLTALAIASCSSAPTPANDPYNDADSQRSRAEKAQDEMAK
jgi:hypothetical protein